MRCVRSLLAEDSAADRNRVQRLSEYLSRPDAPWFKVADDPLMTVAKFADAVQLLPTLDPRDRRELTAWLPALGCEHPEQDKKKGACISDTDLSMMREFFVKPQTTVAMNFSDDPMMGMTTDRFTGSATARLSMQSFTLRTASLR